MTRSIVFISKFIFFATKKSLMKETNKTAFRLIGTHLFVKVPRPGETNKFSIGLNKLAKTHLFNLIS